jgi:hypothetical protein
MQSTVIELSNYTSTDSNPNNAEWTNNLSNTNKNTINDGDYIQVKQVFLDSRQVQSGDIEIVEDIEWYLEFSYYITNHGINMFKTYWDGNLVKRDPLNVDNLVDGQPYLLYNFSGSEYPLEAAINGKPVIDSFTIKIPAGIYTRQFLAAFITRQMQGNPTPQNITLDNLQFSSGNYAPQYDADGNCVFLQQSAPADPKKFITSFNKPLLLASNDNPNNGTNFAGMNVYIDNTGTYQPCLYFPFLKDVVYTNTYETIITTGVAIDDLVESTTKQSFFGDTYSLYDGCNAGANQVSLQYSVDGSNVFSFQYSHTPIINAPTGGGGGNEITGVYVDISATDQPINFATKSKFFNNFSGIVFLNTYTNLTPIVNGLPNPYADPFFAQLGLNPDDIVYSPLASNPILNINASPINLMNPATPRGLESAIFFAKTTRNFNPIANLSNTATISIYNYNLVGNGSTYGLSNFIFNTSTSVVPINFSSEPTSSVSSAGHYLVELQCGYSNGEYINNAQSYEIKAIVGSYFLSSDSFILSNAPDSYIYQHRGEPLKLSSVKVRILNPITKQLANNLGRNSTVYLMITKEPPAPQPIQQEQTEKKK